MKASSVLSLDFTRKPSLPIMVTVGYTWMYFLHLLFTYVYLNGNCKGGWW